MTRGVEKGEKISEGTLRGVGDLVKSMYALDGKLEERGEKLGPKGFGGGVRSPIE